MLSTLKERDFPLVICFHPEDALSDLETILGERHRYLPQKGDDLGRRMEHCFGHAFSKGFQRVVGIGSDIPDLPAGIVEEAFASLKAIDSVIGPSLDGGYYLIGFQCGSFLPEAFREILWGTDTVLKQTMDILKRHKLATHLLPIWRDIDTVEDLKHFFEKNKDTALCPRTIAYLQTTKLIRAKHQA